MDGFDVPKDLYGFAFAGLPAIETVEALINSSK